MQDPLSFIREVEVFTQDRADRWTHERVSETGLRTRTLTMDTAFRVQERALARVLATGRPELTSAHAEEVSITLPLTGSSILVLRGRTRAGKDGCIEMWEPGGASELVHAEGFYGALASFELSSRLARFRRGVGLPGITWESKLPCLIDDVRTSPLFLRKAVANEHALAMGVGIPVTAHGTVTHVLVILTAHDAPVARAVEIWKPDAQGRVWIHEGAYGAGLAAFARASRTTCLLRGEGIAGRALAQERPVLWSRYTKEGPGSDPEAARAGFVLGVAIPFGRGASRAALVLRV